nr:hypothetical protein [Tanacetum cinerariifolium]
MSSLQDDTTSIKSMMTEMHNAFRGQSSSAPSSSVTSTFAITDTLANIKGRMLPTLPLKNHLLILRERLILTYKKSLKNQSNQQMQIGKGIGTDDQIEDYRKPVKASSIVRPGPDEPSALPATEQAPSQTSRRKQKHMKLKTKTRIPGFECNRTFPENVPFVNNMVIEEPEYGIFFTNEFGDQAFQRWSDIVKVGMEALVSYLAAASMVKSLENARFSMKLRKLIAEHTDQEKLKSKKVKLEALGYKMD